jgi:hypothetical protein
MNAAYEFLIQFSKAHPVWTGLLAFLSAWLFKLYVTREILEDVVKAPFRSLKALLYRDYRDRAYIVVSIRKDPFKLILFLARYRSFQS